MPGLGPDTRDFDLERGPERGYPNVDLEAGSECGKPIVDPAPAIGIHMC